MPYRSPIKLLSAWEPETDNLGNRDYVLRLRKKVLAEMALNQEHTVKIGDQIYTKDDVLKAVDELANGTDAELHQYIYLRPPLLEFLEDETFEVSPSVLFDIRFSEKHYHKLSPILFECYLLRIKSALNSPDFARAEELLNYLPYFSDNEQQQFNEVVHAKIKTIISEIKNERFESSSVPEKFGYLTHNKLGAFLNILPEQFENEVDELVSVINNFLIAYFEEPESDKDFVCDASGVLLGVSCSIDLKELLEQNRRYFVHYKDRDPVVVVEPVAEETETPPDPVSDLSGNNSLFPVFIVLVLIIVIVWFVLL